MHCWLITVGEPLPIDGARPRLLRAGRLAFALARAGHEVTWWSSTFDHTRKQHWRAGSERIALAEGVTLRLLHGPGYRRNVSLARLRDHREVARRFAEEAVAAPRPDVILCSFPTIELSVEAVRYGRARQVPVALDIRDLWPDIFADAVPAPLRPFARPLLAPLSRATDAALRGADALIGISDGYLDWGLRRAGRPRRGSDAVIALGYDRPAPGAPAADAVARLAARGVATEGPLLCFVGTFGRTYDLAPVLEAARGLAARGVPGQFVLAGDGERGAEWRARAAGLPNVVCTGWLERDELAALLARASIGLAAYAADAPQGLPNKFFEYLSVGLPIVSSLRGEAEALLAASGAGVTYDPRDPAALTESLATLLGDEARRARMRAAATALFEARFAAEAIDAALIAHLRLLADSARVAGPPSAQGIA